MRKVLYYATLLMVICFLQRHRMRLSYQNCLFTQSMEIAWGQLTLLFMTAMLILPVADAYCLPTRVIGVCTGIGVPLALKKRAATRAPGSSGTTGLPHILAPT